LAAAGLADEGGHDTTRHVDPMRFVPQRAGRRNSPRTALDRGGGAACSVLAWARSDWPPAPESRARPIAKDSPRTIGPIASRP
jgi:hypothetical protein